MSWGGTQEARAAFGARLRELRRQAGLTGRALAGRVGMHVTKVSRVEHGKQGVTDDEIRAWCAACGSADRVDDLITMASSVDSLYQEWRRWTRTGLRLLQDADAPLYDRVRHLRAYEHTVLPGLFHTAAYSNAIMMQWSRFLRTPDDHDAATAPRIARQKILRSGGRQFVFLLAEQTLRSHIGGPQVMLQQLDHLLDLPSLPHVRIGVIPAMAELPFTSQNAFWIWDDSLVHIETVSARVEVTRRDEIALYATAFDQLGEAAAYGSTATTLISAAREDYRRLVAGS